MFIDFLFVSPFTVTSTHSSHSPAHSSYWLHTPALHQATSSVYHLQLISDSLLKQHRHSHSLSSLVSTRRSDHSRMSSSSKFTLPDVCLLLWAWPTLLPDSCQFSLFSVLDHWNKALFNYSSLSPGRSLTQKLGQGHVYHCYIIFPVQQHSISVWEAGSISGSSCYMASLCMVDVETNCVKV